MQGTPKKLDVVKCVRDMRGYPPEFYRLPEDGRKWEHTCFMRRSLAMQLATYADGDGTNITVGVERLRQELGMAKRTFYRRIDELTRLGFIEKDGRTHMRGTAVRHINFEGIWEHAAGARVPHSAPECQIGTSARVPNSAPECQTAQARVPNSAARVPDNSTRVPLTADFGPEPIRPTTPTAFPDRDKKLPPNAGMVGEGTLDLWALPQTP